MTTRQIEECLTLEKLEDVYRPPFPFLMFDPNLVSIENLKHLKPGSLIRLKKRCMGAGLGGALYGYELGRLYETKL